MTWLNSTKSCCSIPLPMHDQDTLLRQNLPDMPPYSMQVHRAGCCSLALPLPRHEPMPRRDSPG